MLQTYRPLASADRGASGAECMAINDVVDNEVAIDSETWRTVIAQVKQGRGGADLYDAPLRVMRDPESGRLITTTCPEKLSQRCTNCIAPTNETAEDTSTAPDARG